MWRSRRDSHPQHSALEAAALELSYPSKVDQGSMIAPAECQGPGHGLVRVRTKLTLRGSTSSRRHSLRRFRQRFNPNRIAPFGPSAVILYRRLSASGLKAGFKSAQDSARADHRFVCVAARHRATLTPYRRHLPSAKAAIRTQDLGVVREARLWHNPRAGAGPVC